MSEHNAPDRPPGKADFEAVRAALLRLGISEELASSDEFTDGEGQSTESRDTAPGCVARSWMSCSTSWTRGRT